MIYPNKLFANFKQTHESCVLASYGVVSHYFNNIPVPRHFWDYCKHYKLKPKPKSDRDAEYKYSKHFDNQLCPRTGYDIILELYRESQEKSFSINRSTFSAGLVDVMLEEECICRDLKSDNSECLLNLTIMEPGGRHHSITVGFSGDKFCCYDTQINEWRWVYRLKDIPYESIYRDWTLKMGVLYKRFKE